MDNLVLVKENELLYDKCLKHWLDLYRDLPVATPKTFSVMYIDDIHIHRPLRRNYDRRFEYDSAFEKYRNDIKECAKKELIAKYSNMPGYFDVVISNSQRDTDIEVLFLGSVVTNKSDYEKSFPHFIVAQHNDILLSTSLGWTYSRFNKVNSNFI